MTSNQEDKIISEFLESIGPWRDFIAIGGGFALFIYKLYLSDPKLKNFPVGTKDIDSLDKRLVSDQPPRHSGYDLFLRSKQEFSSIQRNFFA